VRRALDFGLCTLLMYTQCIRFCCCCLLQIWFPVFQTDVGEFNSPVLIRGSNILSFLAPNAVKGRRFRPQSSSNSQSGDGEKRLAGSNHLARRVRAEGYVGPYPCRWGVARCHIGFFRESKQRKHPGVKRDGFNQSVEFLSPNKIRVTRIHMLILVMRKPPATAAQMY
jgi:hypothetical protein